MLQTQLTAIVSCLADRSRTQGRARELFRPAPCRATSGIERILVKDQVLPCAIRMSDDVSYCPRGDGPPRVSQIHVAHTGTVDAVTSDRSMSVAEGRADSEALKEAYIAWAAIGAKMSMDGRLDAAELEALAQA